jgi:2-haloacid dehalogenase
VERGGNRAVHTFARNLHAGERADEALARRANEDRYAEPVQQRQAREQFEVVVARLAETNARIDDEFGARDAGPDAGIHTRFEIIEDVELDIVVLGIVLHGAWIALRVHQDDGRAKFRSGFDRAIVEAQRRDIVDDVGSGRDGGTHDFGLAGVDGDQRVHGIAKRLDHGHHPRNLLLHGHGFRTRACRLAADIDDIRAVGCQLHAVPDGGLRVGQQAPVGEAVGRDVDDTHDARAVQRQSGNTGTCATQGFEHIGGIERAAAPIALEELTKARDTAIDRRSVSLDDLDTCEIEPTSGKPHPAPHLTHAAVVIRRRIKTDRADVDFTKHCRHLRVWGSEEPRLARHGEDGRGVDHPISIHYACAGSHKPKYRSEAMRLSDFKVLTFDVYGTLIDWETGMVEALEPLTSRVSHSLSRDEILEAHAYHESTTQAQTPAKTYSALLAVVYKRLAEEWDVAVTWDACLAYGRSVGDWPAFPDSAQALGYLKNHYKLVILSNVDNASFAASNRKLGVDFDGRFTAEDIGSYKPSPRNFEYMLTQLERRGFSKSDILHTAESMFHDHAPANAHGLANCWIYRRHDKDGFGATMHPGDMPRVDFTFHSMAEIVEAHKAELRNRPQP